jgi:DNA-binding transcriptional ArsR family regulator
MFSKRCTVDPSPSSMAEPPSAEILWALAHPARLAMLVALENRELTARELAEAVGLSGSQAAVHLRALQAAGLVVDGVTTGRLRTTTHGWAEIDRQLRRLRPDGR